MRSIGTYLVEFTLSYLVSSDIRGMMGKWQLLWAQFFKIGVFYANGQVYSQHLS